MYVYVYVYIYSKFFASCILKCHVGITYIVEYRVLKLLYAMRSRQSMMRHFGNPLCVIITLA